MLTRRMRLSNHVKLVWSIQSSSQILPSPQILHNNNNNGERQPCYRMFVTTTSKGLHRYRRPLEDDLEDKNAESLNQKRRQEYYTKVEPLLRMAEREPYGRRRGHKMVRQYLIQNAHTRINKGILELKLHTWLHMRYAMKVGNRLQLHELGWIQLSRSFLPRSRKRIPLQDVKQIIQDMWYFGRSTLWEDYIRENDKWLERQREKIQRKEQQQQQLLLQQESEESKQQEDSITTNDENASSSVVDHPVDSSTDDDFHDITENQQPLHDFFDR